MTQARLPEERTTLLVEAHGAQPVNVSYATAGGPQDSAYVLLRTPNTLVYCLDSEATTAVTYAWLVARERAARVLPPETGGSITQVGARVVGSITFQGARRFPDARVLSGRDSPDGLSHIALRLGGLTVRAYDRAALDSYARGWVDALAAAEEAFERPPRHTAAGLLERAHAHVHTPYGIALDRGTARERDANREPWHATRTSDLRTLR